MTIEHTINNGRKIDDQSSQWFFNLGNCPIRLHSYYWKEWRKEIWLSGRIERKKENLICELITVISSFTISLVSLRFSRRCTCVLRSQSNTTLAFILFIHVDLSGKEANFDFSFFLIDYSICNQLKKKTLRNEWLFRYH